MTIISEKVQFQHNDKLGRHLVANIDIEPGDVLIEEYPIVLAGHWENEQMKCANCCEDSYVMCKICQFFPLCIDCSQHDADECNFAKQLTKGKYSKDLLVKNFSLFGVLKLLIKLENPLNHSVWNELAIDNFRLNEYHDTEMWQDHEELIVKPFMSVNLMKSLKRSYSEPMSDSDFLHKLCILMDAHSFEVTSKLSGDSLKGIYLQAAKLPHHCVPNMVTAIDDEYHIKIYAAVSIKANEVIYNSYTNPLMGTSQRQHHLRLTRHLDCECSRCLDSTELGTHMSSMKCQHCTNGYATCQLSAHPPKPWICQECSSVIEAKSVNETLAAVAEELLKADSTDLENCEYLLIKYETIFHPNHFMMLELKQNIAAILRTVLMNPIYDPSKVILTRRLKLCEEFLPVIRTIIPGYSKLYALALYEYLLAFVELMDLEFRTKEIAAEEYCEKLQKAKLVCKEAAELLKFEPSNSPEGHLVRRIAIQEQQIDENFQKHNSK